jgi:homoserine dehydrogenase
MRVGVGMLGWGTVGSAVHRVLQESRETIARRLGASLEVVAVAVRDPKKTRAQPIPEGLLLGSAEEVLADPDVDLVVELMGGLEPARTLVLHALRSRKPVVTANKALLAEHGAELFEVCDRRRTEIAFEAAVGGAVPIIRTLRLSLAADRIERLVAIINGTTNYVLGAMEAGLALEAAVAEAQRLGFAEADPSMDLEGHDAAQKLALLVGLAFGAPLRWSDIPTTGIGHLRSADLEYAAGFGHRVKLLARAERREGTEGLVVRVEPHLVPNSSLLASVTGASNAVLLESRAAGPAVLVGQGAGGPATASAVVADMIDVARRIVAGTAGTGPYLWADEALGLAAVDEQREETYLRISVQDRPGVLGRLTTLLGEHGVSIASLVQRGQHGEPVDVVLLTHPALRRDVGSALGAMRAEAAVLELPCAMPIYTEAAR